MNKDNKKEEMNIEDKEINEIEENEKECVENNNSKEQETLKSEECEEQEDEEQGNAENKESAKQEDEEQGNAENKESGKQEDEEQGNVENKESAKQEDEEQGNAENKESGKQEDEEQGNVESKESLEQKENKQDNIDATRVINIKERRIIKDDSSQKKGNIKENIGKDDNEVGEIEKEVNSLIDKEIESIKEENSFSNTEKNKDMEDYDLSELRNNILKYNKDIEYGLEFGDSVDIDEKRNTDKAIIEEPHLNHISNNVNTINRKERSFKNGKKKKTYNGAMSKVLVAITAVFMGLIAYIIYFVAIDSKTKLNNEYNDRSLLLEETVVRGTIYSDDGKILAETVKQGDEWKRYYPYGRLFVHAVGRYDKGKTGIELSNDMTLVSTAGSQIDRIIDDINNEKSPGNSIISTLNYKLQKVASDALGNRRGAVVAIEPSTGKILAMVSKPDYDPNYIAKNWSALANVDNSNKSLVNRATQGLYPPGSIFKIVTALGYIRSNNNYSSFSYRCTGTTRFNGYRMQCYNQKVHGNENLLSALANSCNLAFGYIGTQLKSKKMNDLCESLLFNKELPFDYAHKKSSFNLNNSADDTMLAQTAIGQGNTQITPLHAAIITSAIANKGNVMTAYMVDREVDENMNVISVNTPKKKKKIMTEEESNELKKMMIQVTKNGTATELGRLKYDVAGKTGSAEYDKNNNSHAWFVGFAPASNPTIAVSVIVEGAGIGSAYAVPIAKNIFEAYIK